MEKMGLTTARMDNGKGEPDALFFHQLLYPMCDPSRSEIQDDPRKAYYSDVLRFTNVYGYDSLVVGPSFGHTVREVSIPELVCFDGICMRNGVKTGGDPNIHRMWQPEGNFCEHVYRSMTYSRFLQIKRIYKLCHNGEHPKKGEDGFDPAYKFNMA